MVELLKHKPCVWEVWSSNPGCQILHNVATRTLPWWGRGPPLNRMLPRIGKN